MLENVSRNLNDIIRKLNFEFDLAKFLNNEIGIWIKI